MLLKSVCFNSLESPLKMWNIGTYSSTRQRVSISSSFKIRKNPEIKRDARKRNLICYHKRFTPTPRTPKRGKKKVFFNLSNHTLFFSERGLRSPFIYKILKIREREASEVRLIAILESHYKHNDRTRLLLLKSLKSERELKKKWKKIKRVGSSPHRLNYRVESTYTILFLVYANSSCTPYYTNIRVVYIADTPKKEVYIDLLRYEAWHTGIHKMYDLPVNIVSIIYRQRVKVLPRLKLLSFLPKACEYLAAWVLSLGYVYV